MTSPVITNPNLTDIESQIEIHSVVKWNGREVSQIPPSHDNIGGYNLERMQNILVAMAVIGAVMAVIGWPLYALTKEGSIVKNVGLGLAIPGTFFAGISACIGFAILGLWICLLKEKD